MKKILAKDWIPVGGMDLEANALTAITTPGNTLVMAGPGSGKTELLAQKACYLLQTTTCQHPRRILAISFKRDAAFNIKERVARRCGPELSQRFDSYTFDKFAKQLVDRFMAGVPAPYAVAPTYELLIGKPVRPTIEDAFRAISTTKYYHTRAVKYEEFITSVPLPHDDNDLDGKMIKAAWLYLTAGTSPKMDLRMIMRLAQYIIETNPILRSFLQQTYSHVFLDEFQDTTFLQYDLLGACFAGSNVNYTAVGDDKQTIMKWAGAIPGIFGQFLADTGATPLPLTINFRSAPKLIYLQNYLVEHLLKKKEFAKPSPHWKGGPGQARMCYFDNQAAEISYLVKQIVGWVTKEKIAPREICILVKQTPPQYTTDLIAALIASGVEARDEMVLQDLLCEEVAIYVLNALTVIFGGRYGKESDEAFGLLCNINASYEDVALVRLKTKFMKFIDECRSSYDGTTITIKELGRLIVDIVQFAGIPKLKITFPQYQQGNFCKKVIEDLFSNLKQYYSTTKNITAAIATLLGKESIPVMTAHKSKGLEYHSVIFIGLEDGAFWTYNKQKDSDDNLVFVALSRAKERVLFTFCAHRNGPQTADSIEEILGLLSGSPDVDIVDLRKPT